MKTMEKFANWFVDRDKQVMEAYNRKERKALDREIEHLQEERRIIQSHLHRIEALIEKEEEIKAAMSSIN